MYTFFIHIFTNQVKSYESINFLSSEHKKGNHTPPSTAAISDSLEEVEAGGNSKSASISLESIPGAIANEAKEEPYYDSVPLDTNDGEYVYIQAGINKLFLHLTIFLYAFYII